MLTLNLSPIFKARGIERPYSFLVKAGISPKSAHSILQGEARSFRLDHIELLCDILVCEPNDLLAWVPDKSRNYPASHPLYKLQTDQVEAGWLSAMPFKELKEVIRKNSEGK